MSNPAHSEENAKNSTSQYTCISPAPAYSSSASIFAVMMLTGSTGLSSLSVFTIPILLTTCIPSFTRPKIVCFPSSHGVGARVMKLPHNQHRPSTLQFGATYNCDPLVSGPEFAILNMPAPVCFRPGCISSANFPPSADRPPRPVPVGSPPWIMNPGMMRWNYCADWPSDKEQ